MRDHPEADEHRPGEPATLSGERGPWRAALSGMVALTGLALLTALPGADVRAVPGPVEQPVVVGHAVPAGPAVTVLAFTSGEAVAPGLDAGGPVGAAEVPPVDVEFTEVLPDERAAVAIRTALAQIGLPYVWGGNGPTAGDAGFDCSGLTTFSYAAAGIGLPRTAHTQYYAGPHVPAGAALQPGDLVFYGTAARVHHVGLYLGQGRMVNAPTFGKPVQVASYRWAGDDYLGATRPAGSPTGTGLLPVLPEPRADAPAPRPVFEAPPAPLPVLDATGLPTPLAAAPVAPVPVPGPVVSVPVVPGAAAPDAVVAESEPRQGLVEGVTAPDGPASTPSATVVSPTSSAPPRSSTTEPPAAARPSSSTAPSVSSPPPSTTRPTTTTPPPPVDTDEPVGPPVPTTVEVDGTATPVSAVGSGGGLPARTGIAGRFVRLPNVGAAPGSSVVVRMSDGTARRYTVTDAAGTLDTAAAAGTAGALVLVSPAGAGSWAVWSAS